MPNIFRYLKRPEYVFNPRQVLRRFERMGKAPQPSESVTLPWGATVRVHPSENVGSEIYYYGVFDRIVPEAICRLADGGELAVEIGANIGQNCSLMAYKTGAQGRTIAFEPHPEIFEELKANASLWPGKVTRNIQLENVALGQTTGEAWLTDGAEFSHNRGSAALSNTEAARSSGHKVVVHKLDDYIPAPAAVGVCKIDVEGHELSVLKGAEQALSRKAIRDIIFEDFAPKMPSPTAEFLQAQGFSVYQLIASWWKPLLKEISPVSITQKGFTGNYLATLDPKRAKDRFRAGGWRCLTRHSPLS